MKKKKGHLNEIHSESLCSLSEIERFGLFKRKRKRSDCSIFLSFYDGSQCDDLMGIIEIEIEWSKSLNLHALNKEI